MNAVAVRGGRRQAGEKLMFIADPKQKGPQTGDVVESVEAPPPRPVGRWLLAFWLVILVKCGVVGWYYASAETPPEVGAAWIVVPTLIFAGIVSLILVRRKV
jgi:hypothetical protein